MSKRVTFVAFREAIQDPAGRRQLPIRDMRGDDLAEAKMSAQGITVPGPKGALRTLPWGNIAYFDTVEE